MKGIDFKAAAMKAAGHAAGAAAFTQLNKLDFMKKLSTDPAKASTKGLVTAAIGYLAVPLLAAKMKLGGKGAKGAFIEHAGEGIGMIGVMIAANAFVKPTAGHPALFPSISGYEENPQGMGYVTEEDNMAGIEGYEESPLNNSSVMSSRVATNA